MSVKIYSQNVRGIRDFEKRRKVFTCFKKKNVDVLLLQETYSDFQDEKFWKAEWGGNIVFSHGGRHSKGVAIAFRKGLDYKVIQTCADQAGRYIICTVEVQARCML